ncbi:MAG: sulfurtransferase [Gammaproteobacteria bacterium]|nr:sulfurtransferase [Gammaproteobacteria bacterium]
MSIKPFSELVAAAKARIREVSVDDVKRRLDAGAGPHLIDVREDGEWARGHLPGAAHLSRGLLDCNIGNVFADADAEIVLYCAGGARSALAAVTLADMGYTRVASMAGGFKAWQDAGYPVGND